MKANKNDVFDKAVCIEALATVLIELYSCLWDFTYFFTFKKELKCYEADFRDPHLQPVDDLDFFKNINDPVVKHGVIISSVLIDFSEAFNLRHGLDAQALVGYENVSYEEVERYLPKRPLSMVNKSYARLFFYFERYLEESINCLYYYCCALSLESYQLTPAMKKQLNQINEHSFRVVNTEDNEVALLANLAFILSKADEKLKNSIKKDVRRPKF